MSQDLLSQSAAAMREARLTLGALERELDRKNAEARALPIRRFDNLFHEYLWSDFAPHFAKLGPSALELGCFKGHFTGFIRHAFPDVTVVDAAKDCLDHVKSLYPIVECEHGTFEEVRLEAKFDAVFLVHALEHCDDPQKVLRRINDEWLYDDGLAFIAVPNGHAASRQIAVKIGLVTEAEAVTPEEAAHGHKRTYIQETFRQDLQKSGLRVEEIGGCMFKSLSGAQIDQALMHGVIGIDYLDACYELGKDMPLLCNSIYAICSKWKR